jgi:inner membrane protein
VTSVLTHGILGAGLRPLFPHRALPRRVWIVGALFSMAPDLDAIGLRLGIPYGHFFGHRGFSHSILFAVCLTLVGALVIRRISRERFSSVALTLYLLICTTSHGILDAMTTGGRGIAFFSPFDTERYFLPWRPLLVSPIGIGAFFSEWGLAVIQSEARWVWLPLALLVGMSFAMRRFLGRGARSG